MSKAKGRLSKHEQQFIKDSIQNHTYVEIAELLNRAEDSVKNYIENKLNLEVTLDKGSLSSLTPNTPLREKEVWDRLEKEFSPEELVYFEYEYNQITAQFKNDVLPTEELQIIDAIKIGIMMNRNLKQQREDMKYINELKEQLERENKLDECEKDQALISHLQQQVAFQASARGAMVKEYKELQGEKNKILTALKATRADRIRRIENSSESFLTWMSEIINDPEKRLELGRKMEKMRLSAIDESVRLSAYHKYEDGIIDQPLLTPDTVKPDNILGKVHIDGK